MTRVTWSCDEHRATRTMTRSPEDISVGKERFRWCSETKRRIGKKLRALEPFGSRALFKLCREVFEAPRLNLTSRYPAGLTLARGVSVISCANLCMPVQKAECDSRPQKIGGRMNGHVLAPSFSLYREVPSLPVQGDGRVVVPVCGDKRSRHKGLCIPVQRCGKQIWHMQPA